MDLVREVADSYLKSSVGPDVARVTFLRGIWQIQSRIGTAERPYDAPDVETAREALVTGQPLFLGGPPIVPLAEYLDAVALIAAYTAKNAGLPAEKVSALETADFGSAIDQQHLDNAYRSPEEFVARVVGVMETQSGGAPTPSTSAFVLVTALVPFLLEPSRRALESLGDFDRNAWGHGTCPVCGNPAAMGRMGESTKAKGAERALWCGICHAEWNYERIRCVRCGSRNPDELRYTYVDGDPAHRVHLCEACHGYAKFTFIDDLAMPVSMVVEDAVTATLDAVALESGYSSKGIGGAPSN
jgi:FdhE protein